MTDEEKAEEYTDSINTIIYDIDDNAINIAKYLRKAYLDGLAEGRKELEKELGWITDTDNYVSAKLERLHFLEKENAELKKQLDSYKALESHYEEIEEDAKAIAKENEELKVQNKDLCESLDIMNNRESELLDQIEKMKNRLNCTKYHYCLCKDKNCKNCKDWRLEE